ncbi:MAG: thiosulfate reductase, partial [Nitrospirota bacterium]|nr:thiosulfate reductase [Nitrospirota bacterium]
MPKFTRRDFLTWGTGSLAFLAASPRLLKAMELQRGGKGVSSLEIADRVGIPFTDVCGDLHDGALAFIQEGELMRVEGNPDHIANESSLSAAALAMP